jgi:lactaldehyde reductase
VIKYKYIIIKYNLGGKYMSTNRIILNETSYFGRGSREVLTNEIKQRGFSNVLVVTDKALLNAGVTDKVTSILDKENITYNVFSNLKPNPTIDNVKDGVQVCKLYNSDCIVAVGGGSAIDTAKAIAIIIKNPEFSDVKSLDGVANTKNKCLPIIAFPTTAGTAAEVTINYVITDEQNVKKMVCVDPHDIPVVAIIDSELMESMPKVLAAATGMDALTHAMEGYITKAAWSMTDMFHIRAIKLIFDNLEKAVIQKDIVSIENMALAQYTAGQGFSNVGLGIVHSMAHQLGAVYDTPHGIANALLLPYVMKYNGEVCEERFREILKALEVNTSNMNKEQVVETLVGKITNLSISLGIPQKLNEINVKDTDIQMLAEKAYNDICTGGNPRTTSVEDIAKIYKEAY